MQHTRMREKDMSAEDYGVDEVLLELIKSVKHCGRICRRDRKVVNVEALDRLNKLSGTYNRLVRTAAGIDENEFSTADENEVLFREYKQRMETEEDDEQ